MVTYMTEKAREVCDFGERGLRLKRGADLSHGDIHDKRGKRGL